MDVLLSALHGTADDVRDSEEVVLPERKSSSLGSDGAGDRSVGTEFFLSRAGNVEIVHLESLSFGNEQFGLGSSGFCVQDAFLLVVVIHHGLALEVGSSLLWRATTGRNSADALPKLKNLRNAVIQALSNRRNTLQDESRESNENHLRNSVE